MKLSDSKIKKSYIFPKESICPETEPCTFEPKLKKKISTPPKNVLTFSHISGNGNPGKKIHYISGNGNPTKISFMSGNGTFHPKPEK